MKKVLIISSHAILPPYKSGSKLIYEFSRFLSKKYEIYILHSNEWKYDFILDNNLIFFDFIKKWKLKFLDITFIYKTIQLIKKEKIEVLIMQYPWFALHLFIVKLFTKVKFVMHEHNIEYDRFKSFGKKWWKFLYFYEKIAYKLVDDVLFITKTDKTLAQNTLWVKNKWQICNYWINTDYFNTENNSDKAKELREKYNLKENEKIILFFWSFSYFPNREGLNIIIKHLIPLLNKSTLNYKIFICWWWIDRNTYQDQENIIYTWLIPNIQDYVKWCDIMINPILSWGWVKTKVIESLACGKTVISTQKWAEWINERITDGKLIIVENNDWEKFIQEVIKNINNKDFVSNSFLQEYEWSNIINNLKI